MLKTGGYIAGLDHRVLPETSLENFKYYIRRVREYLGLYLDIPALKRFLWIQRENFLQVMKK